MAALDLDCPRDFFDDPKGAKYGYSDGWQVFRPPDKRIKQSGPRSNGHKPTTLFEVEDVIRARDAGETVYLVEGEPDAEALIDLGLTATTSRNGASNFHNADVSPLHGAKIIAIPDQDDAGKEWVSQVRAALADKADLSFHKIKAGKDVSDHLTHGYGLDDLEPYTPLDPLLAGLFTADWLGAQIFDPLQWVVPGLIPEGFALLVGAPKIGKSWLALGIAIAAASGGRALGKIKIEPRPVLLIALEDSPRRLQDRIRQLIGDDPMPANLHCLTRIQHGSVLNTITAWLATLPASAKPLVILDTLGRVMPPALPGENQYQRDYRVASALQSICRPGMAVLVLHHDRKSAADDFVDTISGTHGIGGAADTIVVINRERNKADGVLKITGRDVEENEYAIKITDGGWTLQGDDLTKAAEEAEAIRAKANLGDLSAQIVDFVNQHHGVQPEEVAQALGIDQGKARTYLQRLADSGRIKKAGRALYTSVSSVLEQHTQYTQHTMYESESDEKPSTTREYGTCASCGRQMRILNPVQTRHPACNP